MKANNQPVKTINACRTMLAETAGKMPLSEVFAERQGAYFNEFTLFVAHYNYLPNFMHEIDIDCAKANLWFAENYQSEINDMYYSKRYFKRSKEAQLDDVFYFLYDDLVVDFDTTSSIVRFLFRKTDVSKIEAIVKEIHKFRRRKKRQKPEISLLASSKAGIDLKPLEVSKPKLSIQDNYNDDFLEIHNTILKRLSQKNDKGLVLLHGKPGTGKTSYIRYLIASLKKDVIFLPPNMAGAITSPNLISVLIDNPNSIFVIEDAENIVVDREQDGGSPVSVLLNISDGLLADCLNIQIICSFNTDISKIDSALMRKGRLIAKYEFKELEAEKAQRLSDKLGFNTRITQPMLLTAIYHQNERDFLQPRSSSRIGFQALNAS